MRPQPGAVVTLTLSPSRARSPSTTLTGLSARAAVAAEPGDRRVGADDGDRLEARRIERQRVAIVLEQHDRLVGRAAGERAIGRALPFEIGVDVGMLEQAEQELRAQDARHGLIDRRDRRDLPGLHVGGQRGEPFDLRHLEIDARCNATRPASGSVATTWCLRSSSAMPK